MKFVYYVPRYIFQVEDHYELGTILDYGKHYLSGAELEEFENDFIEIQAYEAPLFMQGTLSNVEDLYEEVVFPDGTTSTFNDISAFRITFTTDTNDAEPPRHLIHPHYSKWLGRMKEDSRVIYREHVWL